MATDPHDPEQGPPVEPRAYPESDAIFATVALDQLFPDDLGHLDEEGVRQLKEKIGKRVEHVRAVLRTNRAVLWRAPDSQPPR